MYRVCKRIEISASHILPDPKIYGKCANLHGHNWVIEVVVESKKLQNGMVINFSDLKNIMKETLDKLDHAHLNPLINLPTAENLAKYIYDKLSEKINSARVKLKKVVVYETRDSFAEFESE